MSELRERFTLTDLLTRDDVLEGRSVRDLLLAHGVRLFHRFGVHGTSIDKILDTTGKSKSQFYRHFKDKDDFVCQVLELEMTTMLKMTERYRLDRLEDLDDWFSPYLELASLPGNLGCPVGPVASELGPSVESVRDMATRQFARWEQKIADDLILLAARQRFDRSFPAETVARTLACSIQGAFLMGRVYQNLDFMLQVKEGFRRELEPWNQ